MRSDIGATLAANLAGKLWLNVGKPEAVGTWLPVLGRWSIRVELSGDRSLIAAAAPALHNLRRNPLCIAASASRLRGHKQYAVHAVAM